MALLLILLMFSSIPSALAEDAAKPTPALVELDGELLFTVWAGTKTFSPEMIAAQVAAHIKELTGDFKFRPERITSEDFGFATEISGDGHIFMAVFDIDG
jgi:hypothetical protein